MNTEPLLPHPYLNGGKRPKFETTTTTKHWGGEPGIGGRLEIMQSQKDRQYLSVGTPEVTIGKG